MNEHTAEQKPADQASTIELDFSQYSEKEMAQRAAAFYAMLRSRRTVRDYSNRTVAREVIENCLRAAGSAPSGANRQPWHFAVVGNQHLKREIRLGAELEEREFYSERAPKEWLDALQPFGTDANKPFLETAPYLIVVFAEKYSVDSQGNKKKNYYVPESVSIATGMLIAALHHAGLATLTHTPTPMKFLNKILERPTNERPLMIIVVGYPAANARVPDITRKDLDQIASFHD